MLEVADPLRVLLGVAASNGRAPVGRAIIDHQQLPRGESLRHHAADRLLKEALSVQEGHDH
jgi:hypothetical protein